MDNQNWKVFISSTSKDLSEYRRNTISLLRERGYEVVCFEENFKKNPLISAEDICLENIYDVDFMILLLNEEYGSRYKKDTSISITHAEYRYGINSNKPIYHFIKRELVEEYNEVDPLISNNCGKWDNISFTEYFNANDTLYAKEPELLLFVNEVLTEEKGNYSSFYLDWKELEKGVLQRLGDFSFVLRDKLINAQRKVLLNTDDSRQFWLTLEEILKAKLYLNPRWTKGIVETDIALSNELNKWLDMSQSIVLKGNAGAGKTTTLSKSFVDYSNRKSHRREYAIYIKLKDIPLEKLLTMNKLDVMNYHTQKVLRKLPYPDLYSGFSLRLYLDGLDEVGFSLDKKTLNSILNCPIMLHPKIISTRNEVAEAIKGVANEEIGFSSFVTINDWTFDMVKNYLIMFLRNNNRQDLIYDLDESKVQKQIKSLINSPLTTIMYSYLIYESNMSWPSDVLDCADLFNEFLNKWINREISRQNISKKRQFSFEETIREAWQKTAWIIYKCRNEHIDVGVENVIESIFDNPKNNVTKTFLSTAFMSMLVVNQVTKVVTGFVHEQFMEYLVAEQFIKYCLDSNPKMKEYLVFNISSDVNDFIKAIWVRRTRNELKTIIENLEGIINEFNDDAEGLQAKANAIYYLSRIPEQELKVEIEKLFWDIIKSQKHCYIKNGARFALVRLGDINAETALYYSLSNDKVASSINRRLHLEYFGDVDPLKYPPNMDDGRGKWDRTLKKLLEHISNSENERFIMSKRIDIFTIRDILLSRKDVGDLTLSNLCEIKRSLIQSMNRFPTHLRLLRGAMYEYNSLYANWRKFSKVAPLN